MVDGKPIDGAEAARIVYGGGKMSISNILHNIQKQLKVPKGNYNSFGKYKYRSCEDIIEAVKLVLPEGYAVTLSDEIIMLGDRYYIKAQALLFGDAGQIIAYGYARESLDRKGMDDSQITGTASSYARKYALNGLFAIDDTKDADTEDHSGAPKAPKVYTAAEKLEMATQKAKEIMKAYEDCKTLDALADVQEKYHLQLKSLSERYDDLFKQINTVGLQVIGSFDKN